MEKKFLLIWTFLKIEAYALHGYDRFDRIINMEKVKNNEGKW